MGKQEKSSMDKTVNWSMVLFFVFVALCLLVGAVMQANSESEKLVRLEKTIDSLNAVVLEQQNDIDSLVRVRSRVDTLIAEKDRVIKSIVVQREATVQKIGTLALPDLVNTFKTHLDSARP
jgi:hypothetical protein